MKLCFFSDIHGNSYAYKAFLKRLKTSTSDKVFFLGDVFGYYYGQNDILDSLRDSQIVCLLGNHDQYFLDILNDKIDEMLLCKKYGNSYRAIGDKISTENVLFLNSLRPFHIETIDFMRFGIFHGSPCDPLNGRVYPDTNIDGCEMFYNYDCVILGHTHHKMYKQAGTTLVLNPGSLGQQRDGQGCSYLEFDTRTRSFNWETVYYPIEELERDIDFFDAGNLRLKEVLHRKRG